MNEERRLTLAACVDFYLKVYERPTFLQRNIRKSLARHRADRQQSKKPKLRKMGSPNGIRLPQASVQAWNPKEIINMLEQRQFSQHDPILQIDVTGMEDRMAKFKNMNNALLPQQTQPAPIPASCSLTIWDSSQSTLVEQTRHCHFIPQAKENQERYASIKLDAPFMIQLKQLNSSSKVRHGEVTFSTQFVIMPVANTETWPPIDTGLPEPKKSHLTDDRVNFVRAPTLVAKWTRLPDLPEKKDDCLLEIRALQDDHIYKPKLSLKFEAKWVNTDSPLAVYNKQERLKNRSISPKKMEPDSNIIIQTEWIWKDVADYMQKTVMHGYSCPLCHGRTFDEATEYHFHLKNNHDLFNFEYSIKFETNIHGQSISRGTVQVTIAVRHMPRLKNLKEDFAWQCPREPFELELWLQGDESWVKNGLHRTKHLQIPHLRTDRSSSREQSREVLSKARRRPIEDIPDIVDTQKRRFKVPRAPKGKSFYRTFSKVPLQEGDDLSESDDEINEEWLLEKHADTIDSFTDTLPIEKQFMQRFDRHMLKEDPASDLHAEESLVRFCKQNVAWLRGREIRFEFAKKIAALKINGLLSNDIIRACWKIINDTSIDPKRNVDDMEIDATSFTTGSPKSRGDNGLEGEHVYGRCGTCDRPIDDPRDLVFCDNGRCRIATFHLHCISNEQNERPGLWVCPTCTGAGYTTKSVFMSSASNTTKPSAPVTTGPNGISQTQTLSSRLLTTTQYKATGINSLQSTPKVNGISNKHTPQSLPSRPGSTTIPESSTVPVKLLTNGVPSKPLRSAEGTPAQPTDKSRSPQRYTPVVNESDSGEDSGEGKSDDGDYINGAEDSDDVMEEDS